MRFHAGVYDDANSFYTNNPGFGEGARFNPILYLFRGTNRVTTFQQEESTFHFFTFSPYLHVLTQNRFNHIQDLISNISSRLCPPYSFAKGRCKFVRVAQALQVG
jgi:hypothetical protein